MNLKQEINIFKEVKVEKTKTRTPVFFLNGAFAFSTKHWCYENKWRQYEAMCRKTKPVWIKRNNIIAGTQKENSPGI